MDKEGGKGNLGAIYETEKCEKMKTCCSVKLNVDQNPYKTGLKSFSLSGFIQERTGNEEG